MLGIHVKRQKRAMNNSAAVSLINFYLLTTKVKELALRARIGDHSHVKLACKISTSKKPATQFALLLNWEKKESEEHYYYQNEAILITQKKFI